MAVWREDGLNIKLWFWKSNPPNAHPCAELHLLTYFAMKSMQELGSGREENQPPPKKVKCTKMALELMHGCNDKILFCDRYPQHNHRCKFLR